jgi:Zn-finger nucleic acid-binding protein
MKCPQCDTTLAMGERLAIQIDYCPNCRGIWLEKDKLDKLLDQIDSSNQKQEKKKEKNKGKTRMMTKAVES